ncbi:hypothetical protein BJ546DRAFT_238726 [Cryomyces antarcticus]
MKEYMYRQLHRGVVERVSKTRSLAILGQILYHRHFYQVRFTIGDSSFSVMFLYHGFTTFLQVLPLFVSAVPASPGTSLEKKIRQVDNSVPIAQMTPIYCETISPLSADCDFDWSLDQAIGTMDVTDPVNRANLYQSTYRAVLVDDLPIVTDATAEPRGLGRPRGGKRDLGLFNEVASWFQSVSRPETLYATLMPTII